MVSVTSEGLGVEINKLSMRYILLSIGYFLIAAIIFYEEHRSIFVILLIFDIIILGFQKCDVCRKPSFICGRIVKGGTGKSVCKLCRELDLR